MGKHRIIGLCGVLALFLLGGVSSVIAAVSGQCSNCHTMHNSQNNSSLVSVDGAKWVNGTITGGSGSGVQRQLLVTDCVGCHSNAGTETILRVGSSVIPIVYNTGGYPDKPLAGGNFALVPGDDSKGHNVLGIANPDSKIAYAPGGKYNGERIGCASNSCHNSLAVVLTGGREGGCKGCHNRVKHHGVDPAPGTPENAASGWYRFLGNHDITLGGGSVVGIEDTDWEYTKSATDHNVYRGGTALYEDVEAMSRFCAGCHGLFHANTAGADENALGFDNSAATDGMGSPWLRHPADFAIPNKGEYAQVLGVDYNPDVPVAKPNLASYDAGVVQLGDMVMCLSCHRAHGSNYSDMLRWDYTTMTAHGYAGDQTTGCFYCHRTKDT